MIKKRLITIYQFQQWHPIHLVCDTDPVYAKLANAIYDKTEELLSFMEPNERPAVAIGLAHYIEDRVSGTHQMDVFKKLYREMYGNRLPFYSEDSDTPLVDEISFVVWLLVCSQRNGRILNPVTGTKYVAEAVLPLVENAEEQYGCKPNDDLAGYLYSEDTLDDSISVKSVLMWIESRSFLGRWYNNDPNDDMYNIEEHFDVDDPDMIEYANASLQAFDNPAWPVSMSAQRIYAEMIRMDVEDPDDEMALDVENMKFREYGFYHGLKAAGRDLLAEDYNGEQFVIEGTSSAVNLLKHFKNNKYLLSAFFEYRGKWNLCGSNGWMDFGDEKFKEYADRMKKEYHYMHDFSHQYDKYIKAHDGRRVYFFKNFREYTKWLQTDLGMKNANQGTHPKEWDNAEGMMAFFEDNGQITISGNAAFIKHEDNPYYDADEAEENGFSLIYEQGTVSSTFLQYILANNLLSGAALNDRRGKDYGWRLLQNNIDFLARCLRRDMKTSKVFRPRAEYSLSDYPKAQDVTTPLNMSMPEFIQEMKREPFIRSAAGKAWEVISVDQETITMKDYKGKVVTLDTEAVYAAYHALRGTLKPITSAEVAPYVPKKQLSAATAIVYSLAGNGRFWRDFHHLVTGKTFSDLVDIIKANSDDK